MEQMMNECFSMDLVDHINRQRRREARRKAQEREARRLTVELLMAFLAIGVGIICW